MLHPAVRIAAPAATAHQEVVDRGFRVDAVKHMPHSVFYNFQSRVKNEIEHDGVIIICHSKMQPCQSISCIVNDIVPVFQVGTYHLCNICMVFYQ